MTFTVPELARTVSSRAFVFPGLWLVGLMFACSSVLAAEPATETDREIQFNRDIQPLLSDHCTQCHGPSEVDREADLRLDTRAGVFADLGGYFAVKPSVPEESEAYLRISSEDPDTIMPPLDAAKELSPTQIELFRRWIAMGAPYQDHWAFEAPSRPSLPGVNQVEWCLTPIDHFILRKIEDAKTEPSADADDLTLIRRLFTDLLGLPPSTTQVDEFMADQRSDRIEQWVDRLLDSPHFGERMAMYWLDLVRYADTVGYHGDQEHHASPYRDYVIQAFQENMPFDQFTREQLAGDLLENSTTRQRIASAYNRLLQTTHEGGAQDKEYLAKYAADRIRSLSGVWMGATIGCAECHDHKFDPYTQKDFYQLVAFFADLTEQGAYSAPNTSPTTRNPEMEVLTDFDRAFLNELKRERSRIRKELEKKESLTTVGENPAAAHSISDRKESLTRRIANLDAEIEELESKPRKVMISSATKPREIRLLARGDWMDNSGEVTQPAVPRFLPPLETTSSRATRLDLAAWLTSAKHPLTARVFVNRLWYLFFGQGISRNLDDLGVQGEWPTHPELLDWLAVEFRESGWDVKHVVKLIVTSHAYRQASLPRPDLKDDPENRLFARQNRYRFPAELIRDHALAVSGLLERRQGGASVRPYQPEGYYSHLNFPKRVYQSDLDKSQYRRGVYMHWQRQFLHPMLKAFDAPSREECMAQRPISNTPSAALTLLNDPSFVESARLFATHALLQEQRNDKERIEWMWKQALLRRPTAAEIKILDNLLDVQRSHFRTSASSADELVKTGLYPVDDQLDRIELASWTMVARALLNLNETITRN